MTGRRSGLLGQMWQNIKKSLLIYRTNDLFMGSDQHGNRYFERPEDLSRGIKRQRRVEPLNPDQFNVPKVPVEWMTWLQGRRLNPPTEDEIEKNLITSARTQMRAQELEKQKQAADNEEIEERMEPFQAKSKFPVYEGYEVTPGDKNKDSRKK